MVSACCSLPTLSLRLLATSPVVTLAVIRLYLLIVDRLSPFFFLLFLPPIYSEYYKKWKYTPPAACEIEDFVETHLSLQAVCVILRSRVLRVFIILALLWGLVLPATSNSDLGSHSGPSFPIPATVCAFILFARRVLHSAFLLPSSTRTCRIDYAYPPFSAFSAVISY